MIAVSYNAVSLTDSAIAGVADLRGTGRQLNQERPGVRSTEKLFTQRGNRELAPISFAVTRQFSTVAAAEAFFHDHFGDLAATGDLVFTLSDASTRTYADAVLESCEPVLLGLAVRVAYQFRAGLPT